MEQYNEKSCNNLEKLYYRPIEAALRWCNLIDHEPEILSAIGSEVLLPAGAFPQWPCLRLNTEKIWVAIQDGEMPYGRDGKSVPAGENVRKDRITVKHTDLRAWMAKTYPDQKPPFLFDEIERNTHTAINAESVRALQVERDSLKARVDKAVEEWSKLKRKFDEVSRERDQLASLQANEQPLETRERNTLLLIIAALCKEARLDINTPAKTAGLLKSMLSNMDMQIGETTIEVHLKRIRDALRSRMK
ncbi:MAG TPA: hypothetical protein PKI78_12225 [Anaerolineales bacterium]|jgi:FtsZ-binding cell division protein ZapB|nr:hypothetical protein [Anaerolineales bacterium]